MKKYIFNTLLSLSLVGMTASCDLDAPTQSSMDESLIFSNYSMAEAAVMGIHQSFGETNSYRGRFLPYYGLNSDVEWINGQDTDNFNDGGKNDLGSYGTAAGNGQMNSSNNAYAKLYEAIERANKIIEGLRTYGNTESDSDMAQLLGETLTLRAFIYLDLIKAWGDVPARFEPITSETLYLPRSNRDEIFKQLLVDLDEASKLVAWPNDNAATKSTERVSRTFAKGLRARIALYAGGYSQRQGGAISLSNDPELERTAMYTIVKNECLEIINSGKNKLGEFKDNFLKLCKDDVTAGEESIWEIPFSEGRGRVLYTFGVKHNSQDQYTQQAQGGVNGPLPYLFYDYDVEDVRRDITCVPYDWSKETTSKQQLRALNNWCFGKLRYEWMNRIVTSTNDDGVNWQAMRMADIYLMAAEVINELEGPAAAAPYLKPILDRALPAAKVTAYMSQATASKDAFFKAIVDQRALEFAGECLRKADLIRWNMLKEKLDEAKEKMVQLRSRQGAYADLPEKLYYQTAEDGETLVIYGLNHGDTDEAGAALGYESNVTWISESKLEDKKINWLYNKNPDENQYWPIWQEFVDSSNGMLNNEWY
ncbi:MAG: RagB/SusD family nutrient uptake outer membrane protein [Bacteroides sp.]|nr:RagB/SusD family nutrient uptake outer membrane protein [Bacteroides sp.]